MKLTLNERLNMVSERLLGEDFLKGRGLGNEIAFYIFDYPPESELVVRERIVHILTDIKRTRPSLRIKHVNLFDLVVDYLGERNLLDKAIEMQKKNGDAFLLAKLTAPLQSEKLAEVFAKQAEPLVQDLVFVSGVGSAYPMLRSHSLLNNLQRLMGNTPLVLFFPGGYNGQALSLFNRLLEENYYRAFKLIP